jgi:hypothetical protein
MEQQRNLTIPTRELQELAVAIKVNTLLKVIQQLNSEIVML